MSGMYKDNILPSNESWEPGTGSYTNKDLERWYGCSRCWPNCTQSYEWVKTQFSKLLKENLNYKPEYFDQEAIDRIRKKIT